MAPPPETIDYEMIGFTCETRYFHFCTVVFVIRSTELIARKTEVYDSDQQCCGESERRIAHRRMLGRYAEGRSGRDRRHGGTSEVSRSRR